MGASVRVIAANVDESLLLGLNVEAVVSANELEKSLSAAVGEFDVLVMAAAVADFTPSNVSKQKIKRTELDVGLQLSLEPNPDILASVAASIKKNGGGALIIGFAAESELKLEELALRKLAAKGCDFVVANDISSGEVFNSEHNSVTLVSESESSRFSGSKYDVARGVLEAVSSKVVRARRGDSK
jgi:phosphopantothenoylcysteine decarboxylase/phosphopantothenate--cysteine ligase